jgi:hypothetical protein
MTSRYETGMQCILKTWRFGHWQLLYFFCHPSPIQKMIPRVRQLRSDLLRHTQGYSGILHVVFAGFGTKWRVPVPKTERHLGETVNSGTERDRSRQPLWSLSTKSLHCVQIDQHCLEGNKSHDLFPSGFGPKNKTRNIWDQTPIMREQQVFWSRS